MKTLKDIKARYDQNAISYNTQFHHGDECGDTEVSIFTNDGKFMASISLDQYGDYKVSGILISSKYGNIEHAAIALDVQFANSLGIINLKANQKVSEVKEGEELY